MKISLKKYAEVLAQSLKGEKDPKVINERIENLLKLLIKRKQAKLIKQLPESFKSIWLSMHGKMEIKATLPKELTAEEIKNLEKLLKDAFKKDVILDIVINPATIGGMKLEFGEYIIDGTVLSSLETFKSRISQ